MGMFAQPQTVFGEFSKIILSSKNSLKFRNNVVYMKQNNTWLFGDVTGQI